MTEYIPAQSGIYVLLVSPQKHPEDVDFSDFSNWCRRYPVIGWRIDGEKTVPISIGIDGNPKEGWGDVYIFPDGQVYDESKEDTFANLAAWIKMQFDVEGPNEFNTAPDPSQEPARPPQGIPPGVAPTLRDLGVSGRACAPLERQGITTLHDLCPNSREDILSVRGVSKDAVKMMDGLLAEHNLEWGMTEDMREASVSESDDDVEDLL